MKRVTRALPGLVLRLVGLNILACASQDGVVSTKPGQTAAPSTGGSASSWVVGGLDVSLGIGGARVDCVDELVPPNSGMGAAGAGGDSGVCGCDGNVYASADEAKAAASGVDEYGYCLVPAHLFGCGAKRCVVGQEYCGAFIDHADCCEPKGHTCAPLKPECVGVADSAFANCVCPNGTDASCRVVPVSAGWAVYVTPAVGR